MEKAKIFQNGSSQAVRLPKEYRFDCDEVAIRRLGHLVMLYDPQKEEEIFDYAVSGVSDDFVVDRDYDYQPEREWS